MPESRANILVVEDNADEAQMISMILEPEGYRVTRAANGQEGLTAVEAAKPDLIILDVMMPILDGFAMCAKLREDPDLSDIPVILLTAVADRVRDTKYPLDGVLRAEAEEYLEKPVDPESLLATVRRWLK
jgi:two-component system alkaline phosphatase synthesis response regulator PhoP